MASLSVKSPTGMGGCRESAGGVCVCVCVCECECVCVCVYVCVCVVILIHTCTMMTMLKSDIGS